MNKKKMLLGIAVIIIVCAFLLGGLYFSKLHHQDTSEVDKPVALDTIKKYNYTLEDRDTDIYKLKFDELKTILSKKEIDYEAYAKALAELYIIDLYTLKNKTSVYDVGALEFVYPDSKDNFALKVQDTIYKYMEDNSKGTRSQELPLVTKTNVESIEENHFVIKDKEYDGYYIKINWEYEKDLEYDTEATIGIIRDENKLYVALEE